MPGSASGVAGCGVHPARPGQRAHRPGPPSVARHGRARRPAGARGAGGGPARAARRAGLCQGRRGIPPGRLHVRPPRLLRPGAAPRPRPHTHRAGARKAACNAVATPPEPRPRAARAAHAEQGHCTVGGRRAAAPLRCARRGRAGPPRGGADRAACCRRAGGRSGRRGGGRSRVCGQEPLPQGRLQRRLARLGRLPPDRRQGGQEGARLLPALLLCCSSPAPLLCVQG